MARSTRVQAHLFTPEDWFTGSKRARCGDCGQVFDLTSGEARSAKREDRGVYGWFEARGRVAMVESGQQFRFCVRRPTRTDDFDPARYPQWLPPSLGGGQQKLCAWLDELSGFDAFLAAQKPKEAEAMAMMGWHLQLDRGRLKGTLPAAFFLPFWRRVRPTPGQEAARLPEGVLAASYSPAKAQERWLEPAKKTPHAH